MPKLDNHKIIYCSLCNGHGRWKGKICPACRGVGQFADSGDWVYCSLCNGHGAIQKYVSDIDTPTKKSGHMEDFPCLACGGKGKIKPETI